MFFPCYAKERGGGGGVQAHPVAEPGPVTAVAGGGAPGGAWRQTAELAELQHRLHKPLHTPAPHTTSYAITVSKRSGPSPDLCSK